MSINFEDVYLYIYIYIYIYIFYLIPRPAARQGGRAPRPPPAPRAQEEGREEKGRKEEEKGRAPATGNGGGPDLCHSLPAVRGDYYSPFFLCVRTDLVFVYFGVSIEYMYNDLSMVLFALSYISLFNASQTQKMKQTFIGYSQRVRKNDCAGSRVWPRRIAPR